LTIFRHLKLSYISQLIGLFYFSFYLSWS